MCCVEMLRFGSYILVGGWLVLITHFLTAHPHLMAANVLLILSIYQILLICDIIILCPD